jgi:diguanylate cyclase (GGDEF)-like protein
VGPAFLLFTALLLVAVADQGRMILERATTDALTGLPNRVTFLERARRELARAERSGSSLALAMLDIDRFKRFNDRYGHQAGDRVLAQAGRAVAGAVRGIDIAGRYGGEELVLVLVDVEADAAVAAVERVRAAIAEVRLPNVQEAVTASAGVALHHGAFDSADVAGLIRRADEALYRSKAAGRDRTTLESRGPDRPTSPAEVRYR